jgi:Flp pilus assembly pilin Flp
MKLLKRAQGLSEYALIIVLIAVFCITALGLLADDIDAVLTDIGAALQGV